MLKREDNKLTVKPDRLTCENAGQVLIKVLRELWKPEEEVEIVLDLTQAHVDAEGLQLIVILHRHVNGRLKVRIKPDDLTHQAIRYSLMDRHVPVVEAA